MWAAGAGRAAADDSLPLVAVWTEPPGFLAGSGGNGGRFELTVADGVPLVGELRELDGEVTFGGGAPTRAEGASRAATAAVEQCGFPLVTCRALPPDPLI